MSYIMYPDIRCIAKGTTGCTCRAMQEVVLGPTCDSLGGGYLQLHCAPLPYCIMPLAAATTERDLLLIKKGCLPKICAHCDQLIHGGGKMTYL